MTDERPTTPDKRPDTPPTGPEEQAVEIAEQYLELLQKGQAPDRQTVLAAHPEIATLLERQFELIDILRGTVVNRDSGKPLGKRVGRYRIREVLGRGAFSVVYRAYDPKHRRSV